MKWNLLTVIVLLVILLYAVKGYRKGFVKTLAAMLCLAVTLVLDCPGCVHQQPGAAGGGEKAAGKQQ